MRILQILFGFSGRMRRRGMLLYSLLAGALFWAALFFCAFIAGLVAMRQGVDPKGAGMLVGEVFTWATSPVVIWINAALVVKRLHDIGWSGWHAAWFIPGSTVMPFYHQAVANTALALAMLVTAILVVGMALVLIFKAGEAGDNRFGPSPKVARQAAAQPA
ncbi:MAG TPA: DUF805 domain-containing protein [Roseomonas sp.]|nr:DUF805 domain-containing protein [Roseomonas sp.]